MVQLRLRCAEAKYYVHHTARPKRNMRLSHLGVAYYLLLAPLKFSQTFCYRATKHRSDSDLLHSSTRIVSLFC
jgi:hypothetical protein